VQQVSGQRAAKAAVEGQGQEGQARGRFARLPASTLEDAIPHLRRPFTPEAIRFKVQSVWKKQDGTPLGCLVVAYIDQRLVTERLNHVIPGHWSAEYLTAGDMFMWCRLTVAGVTRTDIGESSKGLSKDLVSDALKRAAVPFGVGVSCYALPQIKMNLSDARGRIEIRGQGPKRTIVLTEYGHQTLRAGYAKWLDEHGTERFGPSLDHGDVDGATFDEAETEVETGITVGDGDGTDPGYRGLNPGQIVEAERLIERAAGLKSNAFSQRAIVQFALSGQSPGAVESYIAGAHQYLDALETADAITEEDTDG
jgi:hypothetical protein